MLATDTFLLPPCQGGLGGGQSVASEKEIGITKEVRNVKNTLLKKINLLISIFIPANNRLINLYLTLLLSTLKLTSQD